MFWRPPNRMKGKRYVFSYAKLRSKVPLMSSDVKVLRKGNNIIIGFCQKTRRLQCMYLAFKYLKIRSKMVQHCLTRLKPKNEWRSPRRKCNKEGSASAKSSKTNVFRENKNAKIVPSNMLTGFDAKTKVDLIFLVVINKETKCATIDVLKAKG